MTAPEPSFHYSGNRLAYGRGQDNPIGLKLVFSWDGKTAKAEFTPNEYHQGWPGLVHGGVILALWMRRPEAPPPSPGFIACPPEYR